MKNKLLLWVVSAGMLCSCSYDQFSAVTAGSSLGGALGSGIGGLMGGPRGHDKGTVVGMLAGGVAAAVITAPRDGSGGYDETEPGEVYSPPRPSRGRSGKYAPAPSVLEVDHLHFHDADGNSRLDAGEQARIEMDIYNRGDEDLYDVSPVVTCSNRRIRISEPVVLRRLPAGKGFRYTVSVSGSERLREGEAVFHVSFGSGRQQTSVKSFRLRTGRRLH